MDPGSGFERSDGFTYAPMTEREGRSLAAWLIVCPPDRSSQLAHERCNQCDYNTADNDVGGFAIEFITIEMLCHIGITSQQHCDEVPRRLCHARDQEEGEGRTDHPLDEGHLAEEPELPADLLKDGTGPRGPSARTSLADPSSPRRCSAQASCKAFPLGGGGRGS